MSLKVGSITNFAEFYVLQRVQNIWQNRVIKKYIIFLQKKCENKLKDILSDVYELVCIFAVAGEVLYNQVNLGETEETCYEINLEKEYV